MAYKGKRSYLDGPWHYCSRCEFKTKIAEMSWQRGLLLCPVCIDYDNDGVPLIGQREALVAAIVATFGNPPVELTPDPKLTDTSEISISVTDGLIY